MANKLRCRLGKHKWKTRGRGDALTYFCQFCGTTRDKAAAVPDGCLRASMAAWSTPLATRGRAACAAQCPLAACCCDSAVSVMSDAEGKVPTGGELTVFEAVGRWA
jgi:hypothetical protein